MFQPGDRVRYTGAYRSARGWLQSNQREGTFVRCTSREQTKDAVGYAQFDNYEGGNVAFYIGDIELIEDEPCKPEDWS